MKRAINLFAVVLAIVAIAFSVAAFNNVGAATPEVTEITSMNSTTATAAVQPVDLTYAAEKALPSVVYIKHVENSKTVTVQQSSPFDFFFSPFGGNGRQQERQVQTPKKTSSGSGVIISADGYIVTNNHVVEGADKLIVTLDDNSEYDARIVGSDPNTDLALIKIEGSSLPAITIANSENVKVGEWVLAIGNPYGLTNTVTAGIISAKARSLGANGIESFIQTDAAINAGNSGGALVNTAGELVGINAMLYSQTGSYSGYGFAIPTTIMGKVVDDLKEYGVVQRAWIGIRGMNVKNYVDAEKEKGNNVDLGTMEGIYVNDIVNSSAADDCGLEVGDVIIGAGDQKVSTMAQLQEIVNTKRPGDKLNITFLRDKKELTKTLTLKNDQGNTNLIKNEEVELYGATFRDISESRKKSLGISAGVEVAELANGKFKEGRIEKGFIILKVNEESVKSVSDLQRIVKSAETSKDPVLNISARNNAGKTRYYTISIE